MTTILDPPQAGLLSAAGMGLASKQRTDSTPVYRLVQDLEPDWFRQLHERWESEVASLQGQWKVQVRIEARFAGTEGTIALIWPLGKWSTDQFEQRFRTEHRKRFGYDRPQRSVEVTVVHALIASSPLRNWNRLSRANQTRSQNLSVDGFFETKWKLERLTTVRL